MQQLPAQYLLFVKMTYFLLYTSIWLIVLLYTILPKELLEYIKKKEFGIWRDEAMLSSGLYMQRYTWSYTQRHIHSHSCIHTQTNTLFSKMLKAWIIYFHSQFQSFNLHKACCFVCGGVWSHSEGILEQVIGEDACCGSQKTMTLDNSLVTL